MIINQELIKKFNKNITSNTGLSNYSWFNLGGPAEYFFKPRDKDQLIEFLKENKKNKLKITILLACIPGSIGGAVIMNSGCYGHDISQVLKSIKVIDLKDCKEKIIHRDEIEFYYRGTNLSNELIITSVILKGKNGSKKIIEKKQKNMLEKKKLSQPSQIKTCGSTFKNIDNEKKAWQLIKETGCHKFKEGDAVISNTHCNFFVNNGKAKSSDIEKLINKVKKTIVDKTGVNLELEIKIVGE